MTTYASLSEYKIYSRIESADAGDDGYITAVLETASRIIEKLAGRVFYPTTETRVYDAPLGDELMFDTDFLSITSITNGDGSTIPAAAYVLLPANSTPKWGVRLLRTSGVSWLMTNGSPEQCISVTGSTGYSATTPEDVKAACLEIAKAFYGRRFGENMSMKTIITPQGVVQLPEGVSDIAEMIARNYRRVGFA